VRLGGFVPAGERAAGGGNVMTRELVKIGWLPLLAAAAHGQTAVVKCTPSGNVINCRVDKPVVNQRSFAYPAIRFKSGDKVTINAGGCVQTGGRGRTWKRYVDPSGPNSDRLYHGLIYVPSLVPAGSLQRISGYLGRQYVLAASTDPLATALVLGYEDDGYADNGYYAHDDGTENQCRNVGDAWVTIRIERTP
jgi:hypothetical protein